MLGSKSGRDYDKISASKLTPIASKIVGSPAYNEARLIIECKTIYKAQLDPKSFLDPKIEDCYPSRDYHVCYYGEILHIEGDRNSLHLSLNQMDGPRRLTIHFIPPPAKSVYPNWGKLEDNGRFPSSNNEIKTFTTSESYWAPERLFNS